MHDHAAFTAIDAGPFVAAIAAQLYLDTLLPVKAAGHGGAGDILFIQRPSFAGGAYIQVLAGAGVQARVATIGQALNGGFLGIFGGAHLVLLRLDFQRAGIGPPGCALVGQCVSLDLDLCCGQLADLSNATALVFQALEVFNRHVGPHAGRCHGVFGRGLLEARGFLTQHQAFDRAGQVAVFDTGAQATRPVVTALFMFMGILHRTVVDAFGVHLQGVAGLDVRGLGEQCITAQFQIAAGLQLAALHLAVAFGLHLAVVMAFEQTAQAVDATGYRQPATTFGGAGGCVTVIAGRPQCHFPRLHIEVAGSGLDLAAVDLQVRAAAHAHRGALELTGNLVGRALLAGGGHDLIRHASRVLARLGLAILGFLGLSGAGRETALLVAGFAFIDRLRTANQQVAFGFDLQMLACFDLGALDAHLFGAGQAQVAGRADVADQYLLFAVRAFVLAADQAEQLTVAGALGGGRAAMVCLDGQRTVIAVEHRVLFAEHGAAFDGNLVGSHCELAIAGYRAARDDLALGVVTFSIAKECTGYQVASVVALGTVFLQGGGADVCLFCLDSQIAAAVQAAALHVEVVACLYRHVPGAQGTALCGFLELVAIAVTAP